MGHHAAVALSSLSCPPGSTRDRRCAAPIWWPGSVAPRLVAALVWACASPPCTPEGTRPVHWVCGAGWRRVTVALEGPAGHRAPPTSNGAMGPQWGGGEDGGPPLASHRRGASSPCHCPFVCRPQSARPQGGQCTGGAAASGDQGSTKQPNQPPQQWAGVGGGQVRREDHLG